MYRESDQPVEDNQPNYQRAAKNRQPRKTLKEDARDSKAKSSRSHASEKDPKRKRKLSTDGYYNDGQNVVEMFILSIILFFVIMVSLKFSNTNWDSSSCSGQTCATKIGTIRISLVEIEVASS